MITIETAPPPVAAPPASPVADLDLQTAWREGWTLVFRGVLLDGSSRIELRRIDVTPADVAGFAGDHDAWEHVVTQARGGSALHRDALTRVDRVERRVIEAFCGTW